MLMIFIVLMLTAVVFVISIYIYNKTKKSKESIYDEMVSIKGWIALIFIIISLFLYILQSLGVIK